MLVYASRNGVVRERRDFTDNARGKVIIWERRDVTVDGGMGSFDRDVILQKVEGRKRSLGRDVMLQTLERGKDSFGRDVMLQTVKGLRGRWGET